MAAQFALCQAALRILLVGLYLRAARHVVQARTLIAVYVVAEGLAGALWLAGAVTPAPVRYVCWAAAVAAEAAAPIAATMRSAGLPLHVEHLPERFGLLVILVLGESIAAIAVGVHQTHWEPVTVTVAILGFIIAVSLWWAYFDLAGAAATHTLADRGGHRSSLSRQATPGHPYHTRPRGGGGGGGADWPIGLATTPCIVLTSRCATDPVASPFHPCHSRGHRTKSVSVVAVRVGCPSGETSTRNSA